MFKFKENQGTEKRISTITAIYLEKSLYFLSIRHLTPFFFHVRYSSKHTVIFKDTVVEMLYCK